MVKWNRNRNNNGYRFIKRENLKFNSIAFSQKKEDLIHLLFILLKFNFKL